MRDAVIRLEKLGDKTKHGFERDYRHERWLQVWGGLLEFVFAAETKSGDEDDPSL